MTEPNQTKAPPTRAAREGGERRQASCISSETTLGPQQLEYPSTYNLGIVNIRDYLYAVTPADIPFTIYYCRQGWCLFNPFWTAVPFRGQTTCILSCSSPRRDCSPKGLLAVRGARYWAIIHWQYTGICSIFLAEEAARISGCYYVRPTKTPRDTTGSISKRARFRREITDNSGTAYILLACWTFSPESICHP